MKNENLTNKIKHKQQNMTKKRDKKVKQNAVNIT